MIKPTKRKAFNFLRSYFDVLNQLENDKDRLSFLLSLINKQFLNEDPEDLNFIVNLCYESQRHQIESSVKGWERASNDTLATTPPTTPPTTPKEEEEEEEEKGEYTESKKPFNENKKDFINWFNQCKKLYTGKEGKSKVLTKPDENNLKKLISNYDKEDFDIAIKNLYNSKWAEENNMRTISHFVRIENFNKYLEQGDTVVKQKQVPKYGEHNPFYT
jgi:hypothetical protein